MLPLASQSVSDPRGVCVCVGGGGLKIYPLGRNLIKPYPQTICVGGIAILGPL